MDSVLSAILNDPNAIDSRRVEQIVAICGDGTLSDGSTCSVEFREFLQNIPSKILKKYSDECLDGSLARNQNSGLILQDIVNEVGDRLGYQAENGFYRGSSSRIGNDGLWLSTDFAFVIETKTSDLSIKLDIIARYREKLIKSNKIKEDHSSILIVLGRQDTGDLEAQIRGSKHAWDMRMIGIDSLFRLLGIKENLNDPRSINQITEMLKPIEYTRVDKLIDVVFFTSWDISTPEIIKDSEVTTHTAIPDFETLVQKTTELPIERRTHSIPVNFYENCLTRINQKLGKNLIKNGKVTYTSSDKTTNVVLLNSKTYKEQSIKSFWYGFRPNQNEFLSEKELSYVAFGCGNEDLIILIPFSRFKEFIPELSTSCDANGELRHSHVVINALNSGYSIRVGDHNIDITEFVI